MYIIKHIGISVNISPFTKSAPPCYALCRIRQGVRVMDFKKKIVNFPEYADVWIFVFVSRCEMYINMAAYEKKIIRLFM